VQQLLPQVYSRVVELAVWKRTCELRRLDVVARPVLRQSKRLSHVYLDCAACCRVSLLNLFYSCKKGEVLENSRTKNLADSSRPTELREITCFGGCYDGTQKGDTCHSIATDRFLHQNEMNWNCSQPVMNRTMCVGSQCALYKVNP
jgi:hypothetical protein